MKAASMYPSSEADGRDVRNRMRDGEGTESGSEPEFPAEEASFPVLTSVLFKICSADKNSRDSVQGAEAFCFWVDLQRAVSS